MEAIDHEAETVLTKKTHHHKIRPAPARPRARQSRSPEYLNSTPKMYTTLGFQKRLVDRFQDEFLIFG